MQNSFERVIVDRLVADRHDEEAWAYLALAACEGPDALAAALAGDAAPFRARAATPIDGAKATAVDPPGAYLSSISVQGFRGIATEASLPLTPGPGLTLVVGRNGSGKSSFAEALELLLTGTNKRWEGRSSVWSDGWRNLHQPDPCTIRAEFSAEGMGALTVERTWTGEATLEASTAWWQVKGKERKPYAELGWQTVIRTHRPLLPYNELGTLLERPSDVYDALAEVLGLDDLLSAQKHLQQARKGAQLQVDTVNQRLSALLPKLTVAAESGDGRATKCLAALRTKKRDLETLSSLLSADAAASSDPSVALLRRFHLTAPSTESIQEVAQSLDGAAAAVEAASHTDAGRARELARLLDDALRYHRAHRGNDCPVCGAGGRLDAAWQAETAEHVAALRFEADAAEQAHRRLQEAFSAARHLTVPTQSLSELQTLALPSAAAAASTVAAWNAGTQLTDAKALSTHLVGESDPLRHSVQTLNAEVHAELARREDLWQPISGEVRTWLADARAAEHHQTSAALLKKAESWLKDVQADFRQQRFQPIAQQAIAIWNRLRQNSNVALSAVELQGAATQRRVALDVTVDGVAGAALGVMSQGELNALALSLFMPRAALPDSPFRFMVIDDPVQSMDPSRVEGLASALSDAAQRRQVIVFTHDDRLPESVRRLGIPATVVAVTRRPGSVVETRHTVTPVQSYLQDAHTIRLTKELPAAVKSRVLPGFCRSAIEAACIEKVRSRRLKKGQSHAEVEQLITQQKTLNKLMALALFDDAEQTSEVLRTLNRKWGAWAADIFQGVNRGTHEAYTGDLEVLAKDAERLAGSVRMLS
jgi:ABC-type Mn2+/Zn2+ transport system ATPase subunit